MTFDMQELCAHLCRRVDVTSLQKWAIPTLLLGFGIWSDCPFHTWETPDYSSAPCAPA
jgi:NADH:ubiquinone oxidoreductase subunit 4 (subunit M)